MTSAEGSGTAPELDRSIESQAVAEANLVKDLVGMLRNAWLQEDRVTGRSDHFWASRLDGELTLSVIGKAFDWFSAEFPGIYPELDRCNTGPERATRIMFRRDFRI